MKSINECTFGIVGMGLMGGAIAMALRKSCGVMRNKVLACDSDAAALEAAKNAGLVDAGFSGGEDTAAMLASCDVVFLCLNPSTLLQFTAKWEHAFKSGALVTDIAGIKGSIAAAAEKFRTDVDFIPGHPMAGAEKGGFANAALCSFQGKNYILAPLARNKPENLNFLKNLIHRMGFERITEVSPAEHDKKIAFTSQLCHVIAAALIDCEQDTKITRFGGGSFEDLTRIAMLNSPMWTELFIENRSALLDRIAQFEGSLDLLKNLISSKDAAALEKRLAQVRERRTAMAALTRQTKGQ
jgi:prephenate dehydrogenase